MTHQEGIVQVLAAILSQPHEVVQAFSRGNPFDKLLRSYDEFNAQGQPLYRHRRGNSHYRMSRAAFESGLCASQLYGEHRVPLNIIKRRLLETGGDAGQIRAILRANEVVLITPDEQRRLDASVANGGLALRQRLPENGSDRLTFAGIEIAPSTLPRRL